MTPTTILNPGVIVPCDEKLAGPVVKNSKYDHKVTEKCTCEESKNSPCLEPSNCTDEMTAPYLPEKDEPYETAKPTVNSTAKCSKDSDTYACTMFVVTDATVKVGPDLEHGVCLTRCVT